MYTMKSRQEQSHMAQNSKLPSFMMTISKLNGGLVSYPSDYTHFTDLMDKEK